MLSDNEEYPEETRCSTFPSRSEGVKTRRTQIGHVKRTCWCANSLREWYKYKYVNQSLFLFGNLLGRRRICSITVTRMPGGGGGGGSSICMHIGYVPRERPYFQPWFFRSGAYNFHKLPKKIPFRSITILHFFGGFCRSGDHHFQNFFNFNPFIASYGRLSPNAKRSAPQVSSRPERQSVSSGDSHFHAQNGSSSFRSPSFSSSKRLKLVPEPRTLTLDRELVPEPGPIFHFAAAHTYQNLGWVPPPPPPGPAGLMGERGNCGQGFYRNFAIAGTVSWSLVRSLPGNKLNYGKIKFLSH